MPSSSDEQSETENAPADPSYKDALDSRREVLLAMPEERVLRDLKLDASRAASVGEGTAKKLRRFRAEIEAEFGEHRAVLVDRLVTTARAAWQADVELTLAEPSGDLSELAQDVSHVYGMLIADATSLSKRRLIDGTRLDKVREVKGYQALLTSTLVLIALLREEWPKIAGRSLLTLEDLDQAEEVAKRLALALAHREQGVDAVPARELRARALTALVREYQELRRIMMFLRFYHGDVDQIVPSLWAFRGRGRRGEEEAPAGEPTGGSPAGDAPSNGEPAPPTPGDDESPFTP